jgi:hypothetical protein
MNANAPSGFLGELKVLVFCVARNYAASALSATLGFLATIVSSARAAGSGNTRPCSQFRRVDIGIH